MMAITCDSCRKVIMQPLRDENYFPVLHKDLCRACYRKLCLDVEDIMEDRRPHYSLAGHKQQLVANLNKMTR